MLKILESFGLARSGAEVYIYLAKKGPKTGKEIASKTRLSEAEIWSTLKSLQKKGFVSASAEHPVLFFALSFEQVVDMMITLKDEEAQTIKETRKELLSSWRDITRKKNQADT